MDVERAADGVAIGKVRIEFGFGALYRRMRRAGQLELPGGLQRNAADGTGIAQADWRVAVVKILPARRVP